MRLSKDLNEYYAFQRVLLLKRHAFLGTFYPQSPSNLLLETLQELYPHTHFAFQFPKLWEPK